MTKIKNVLGNKGTDPEVMHRVLEICEYYLDRDEDVSKNLDKFTGMVNTRYRAIKEFTGKDEWIEKPLWWLSEDESN